MVDEQLTYSVPEAARILGVGLHSLYAAVREGRVPALRIGRKPRLRIPRLAVERLLQNPARFSPGNAMDEEEVER